MKARRRNLPFNHKALTMICDFHNRVVIRKKDGTRREIIRCADSAGPYFTQEVTEEQCSQCPRHLAAVELAARLDAPRCKPLDRSARPAIYDTPDAKPHASFDELRGGPDGLGGCRAA